MPLEAFTRWLYRNGRPNSLARAINSVWARAFATGRGPKMVATLEVVGRKSGKPVRLPVVIADLDGERYLVSMLERAGHEWLDSGTLGFLDGAIGYADLQRRFGS